MFDSISLVSGLLPVLVVALAWVTLALSFGWRRSTWRRQAVIGIPVAAAATGLIALAINLFDLVPYHFPASYYVWVGLVVLALAVGALGWRHVANWQRATAVLAVVLTTLSAGVLVNLHYAYYPTIGAALGVNAQHEASVKKIEEMRSTQTGLSAEDGYTVQMPIPGTKSGFKTRDALIWLPPVWFRDPKQKLPVIELLSGAPGSPTDWTRSSYADRTAQAFADAHDGVAPIIVMPDSNGSVTADTECVNSDRGQAETYLTVDVPRFVEQEFGTATGRQQWSIAGLSAGGMCAAMLALRHPDVYATFGDFSGLSAPTVGEQVDPAATTAGLFGGSQAAYDQHDPAYLLRTHSYPTLAGWFEVGTDDSGPYAGQRLLTPLARQAKILTCSAFIPGGQHSFLFMKQAFQDSLPWLSYRLGLTPAPASTAPASCS